MEERQQKLLKVIVEEYIETAAPVGSLEVAEKYFPELSSATIRNAMAQLEEVGLINQPHTSAGRIPTALGYRTYIDYFVNEGKISSKDKKQLEGLELGVFPLAIKNLAKKISELSDCAVIAAFSDSDLYYTGISNLFSQPEFNISGWVYSMSGIIDGLDRILSKFYFQIETEPKILVGSENPFGDLASIVTVKASLKEKEILVGILGPLRMNYSKNLGLIHYSKEIISNLK
jgi:transcriptional regulator of heat shock response